ncbi:hypothetical protein N800_06395 [Lysobacter daejeonensis GH1-9]|uniref:Beta-ketoacyl synthase N-terminal domain-containing protein n=1 Tax=Lysobacter daejeonensis GH1-9 TaxID=1385517 RepID=A0A0A0ESD0_9GAMM|nr:hypothetical protein [Lysobacter daejeonensis]KGM53374.1 hypothetical protein N800_06395 [Lysobacter daejeonensis GH1-9]
MTDQSRSQRLAVVGGTLWLPAGRDANDIIDALRRHRRPSLHATLRDLHGFPVTVADVDGLDEADADWGVAPETEVDVAHRRALALLRPVAEELLLAALPPDAADTVDDPSIAHAGPAMHPYAMHHSQSARAPAAQQRAMLRVVLLLSADWPETAREHAVTQLLTLADVLGHDVDSIEAHCLAVHREADAWQWLAQQASVLVDSSVAGDRLMLLATDSRVSESHVERLHSEDRLLRAGAPEGEVPGEGAAGLLLAAVRLPSLVDSASPSGTAAPLPHADPFNTDEDAAVHLHLPQVARVNANERARDVARTSGDLIARALALAGCGATSSLQVITGADHRPSRMTEAATALVAQRPDLDPLDDALHLGVACGALGVAAPVALLALAAAQARDTATPTLAYSLADPATRAVAVLSPVVSEPRPPADVESAA